MPDSQTFASLWATLIERWGLLAAWADQHTSVGSWIGGLGAFAGVLVAWALTRSEYQRDRRREQRWANNEVNLILRIVNDFEGLYAQYVRGLKIADNEALYRFYRVHSQDPKVHSMHDLARLPISQWPSVESYMIFRRYFNAAISVLESSDDRNTAHHPPADELAEHDTWLAKLRDALMGAKR